MSSQNIAEVNHYATSETDIRDVARPKAQGAYRNIRAFNALLSGH